MALAYDQEVQLRIAAQTEGGASVDALAQRVDALSKELQAVTEASRQSGAAQAESAAKLAAAKSAYDGVKASLQGAQNEYRYLRDRSREAGSAQDIFAAQAAAAKVKVDDLKTSLLVARSNMRDFGQEHRSAAANTRQLATEQNRLAAELKNAQAEASKTKDATGQLAAGMRQMAGAFAGVQIAREFIEANVGMETLERGLTHMMGSAAGAAKEIDWLKSTSNRLGIELLSAGKAYVSLSAATKGTALEGQQTRAIFEAVAGAMAKLGKSGAETEGALQAIAQMAGKGTVSMEELRGQLAERLPGALQATAQAMGVATSELIEMVSSGRVLASDLIPKLTEGLNNLYGTDRAEGAVSAWNRLKNSITNTFDYVGDSGVWTALTVLLGQVAIIVNGLVGAFDLLGKSIGITFGAIASFDIRHPIESVKRWKEAIVEAGEEGQKALDKANGVTKEAAAGQDDLAAKTKATAEAAQQAGAGWLSVVNAYGKLSKAAEENTALTLKSADARKEEAKLSQQLVQAFGTEEEKRVASASASSTEAVALAAVAAARAEEARIARDQATALKEAAGGEAELSVEKSKAIKAAQDNAVAKQAESDKASAAAIAAQQQTVILQIQAETLKDNSARVDELRAAHERAEAQLVKVSQARSSGTASLDQERVASIEAAKAAALYRDALSDVSASITAKAAAARAANTLEQSGLNLALQGVRGAMELARAKGDEEKYIRLKNEASKIEIQIAQLKAAALRAEASASLQLIAAKRAELEASGQLTPVKQAELKAQEAAAKVKQIEADAADMAAKHIKEMASATREARDLAADSGAALGRMATGFDGVSHSADRAAESLRGVRREQQRVAQGGAGTGMGAAGGSETGAPTESGLIRAPRDQLSASEGTNVSRQSNGFSSDTDAIARQAGMRGDEVARFSAAFSNILQDKLADMTARSGLFSTTGTAQSYNEDYANAYKAAISAAKDAARYGSDKSSGDKPSAPTSRSMTVNINAGGRQIPVMVSDDQSAKNLVWALEMASMSSAV